MIRFRALAFVFSLCAVAAAVYLYWFSLTHTSVLEILNIFQPKGAEAPPPEPIAPPLLPKTDDALELVEKTLRIPDRFRAGVFREERTLRIPRSAEISVFAAGLKKARLMAVSPEGWPSGSGILYLTESDTWRVVALPDRDHDGIADEVVTVAVGLDYPHGIAFHDGALWIATTTTVKKLYDDDGDLRADRTAVVINNLPASGNHVSRTIALGPDGKLYVSVGSSCNVCEDDRRRAAILRFNADGSGEEIFASGSRNAVGIIFGRDGKLWATENGRDLLGDDVPPDEVNVLEEGKHYGWPYCYADAVPDETFTKRTRLTEPVGAFCARTEKPIVKLQAHVAPLGLRFAEPPTRSLDARSTQATSTIPEALRGNLLVALHGSWNRTVPVGYEVIRVIGLPDHPATLSLVSGFLIGKKAWGRPVDIIVGADGAIYISDDAAGAVYRLVFAER